MYFCPYCGTQLLLEKSVPIRFHCLTCPYAHPIQAVRHVHHDREERKVDDVLGGPEAWNGFPTWSIRCENRECTSDKAYYKEFQIRSADEPTTKIFRCVECGKAWRDE